MKYVLDLKETIGTMVTSLLNLILQLLEKCSKVIYNLEYIGQVVIIYISSYLNQEQIITQCFKIQ